MNTQSENISELAAALAKAQGEVGTVHKDSANPFFKNRYASLAAVWEAVRPFLAKNNLSVVQMPSSDEKGYYVETQLMHSSGQWIRSRCYMKPAKEDPQGIGSLISYARRYALQAMAMICPDDDDGEAAMGRTANQYKGETVRPVEQSSKPAAQVFVGKKEDEPKPQEKPAVSPSTESAPKFNGKDHKSLFEELIKAGITPDEFLDTYKWMEDKRTPPAAKTFFKMSDNTANLFLFDGIEKIKTDVLAFRALKA
jgi:hypothetical protein